MTRHDSEVQRGLAGPLYSALSLTEHHLIDRTRRFPHDAFVMDTKNTRSDASFGKKKLLKQTLLVYLIGLVLFGATFAERLAKPSSDNHYVHMAYGILHGRLHMDGRPPHLNDWAKYDGKWYVSFPPAPALFMLPGVALFGMTFNDRLFTLLFSAAGPALLFLLLMRLRTRGSIDRKDWEIGLLTALFGVGTVYYFAAVQGSVWYTAHMVGVTLLLLYILASLEARYPVLAGLALGLAFACRPPMLLAAPFLIYELLRPNLVDSNEPFYRAVREAFQHVGIRRAALKVALFVVPIVLIIAVVMWMNAVRFDNPFEFGHRHLQVRWTDRILKWGLFHYHYLARNLAVAFTLLPWLSGNEPYLQIGRHGLAIWFTTPAFLYLLWPKQMSRFYVALAVTVMCVAVPSLLYQNSGWIQFGYRFSLDYMPFLIMMLAAGGRRFDRLFIGLCVFGFVVNLFGAITFDRVRQHYPGGRAATAYFQPN